MIKGQLINLATGFSMDVELKEAVPMVTPDYKPKEMNLDTIISGIGQNPSGNLGIAHSLYEKRQTEMVKNPRLFRKEYSNIFG